MIRHILWAVLLALIAPMPTVAQTQQSPQVLLRREAWAATRYIGGAGETACQSIYVSGDRRIMLGSESQNLHMVMWFERDGWRIPAGTEVDIRIFVNAPSGPVEFMSRAVPIIRARASTSTSLVLTMDDEDLWDLKDEMLETRTMTIRFPSGNEQPWVVPMAGFQTVFEAYSDCVRPAWLAYVESQRR